VLGRHDLRDFEEADLVVKNPGVRPDSPYLRAARRVETDLSLFLRLSDARIIGVTGSKGKSGTASAIHFALQRAGRRSWLGGNITVSPLSFLDRLVPGDEVVLELSSWQLGDLRGRGLFQGRGLLKPRVAVITPILPDHLDRYPSMADYVADKRLIYRDQDGGDATIAWDDPWGRSFLEETRGRALLCGERPLPEGTSGGWLESPGGPGLARLYGAQAPVPEGRVVELVPPRPLVPGLHQKKNLLAAGLALLDLGLPPEVIREGLGAFPGIEHRLELFLETQGLRFYNDSGATIPEAAAAAVRALGNPILITGGTDKNLDFRPLAAACGEARKVVLLAGTGSDKLAPLLAAGGTPFQGPFDTVEAALEAALEGASPGEVILLSPGCTSFGLFLNEFDRGTRWKEAVRKRMGHGVAV
jgi:UDP-N-acetylmuramoylalanine--D-glutamate ligase